MSDKNPVFGTDWGEPGGDVSAKIIVANSRDAALLKALMVDAEPAGSLLGMPVITSDFVPTNTVIAMERPNLFDTLKVRRPEIPVDPPYITSKFIARPGWGMRPIVNTEPYWAPDVSSDTWVDGGRYSYAELLLMVMDDVEGLAGTPFEAFQSWTEHLGLPEDAVVPFIQELRRRVLQDHMSVRGDIPGWTVAAGFAALLAAIMGMLL